MTRLKGIVSPVETPVSGSPLLSAGNQRPKQVLPANHVPPKALKILLRTVKKGREFCYVQKLVSDFHFSGVVASSCACLWQGKGRNSYAFDYTDSHSYVKPNNHNRTYANTRCHTYCQPSICRTSENRRYMFLERPRGCLR